MLANNSAYKTSAQGFQDLCFIKTTSLDVNAYVINVYHERVSFTIAKSVLLTVSYEKTWLGNKTKASKLRLTMTKRHAWWLLKHSKILKVTSKSFKWYCLKIWKLICSDSDISMKVYIKRNQKKDRCYWNRVRCYCSFVSLKWSKRTAAHHAFLIIHNKILSLTTLLKYDLSCLLISKNHKGKVYRSILVASIVTDSLLAKCFKHFLVS